MNNQNNSFSDDELRGMITGNNPVSNAYRELLAYREAQGKPVAWTDEQELSDVERDGCGYLFTVNPITPHADMRRVIPLFAAPPLPVVPDERSAFNAWNNDENLPIAGVGAKNAAWLAWQARGKLAGNSPVTPDGSWMRRVKLPELFEDDRHAVTKAIRDAGGEVEIE